MENKVRKKRKNRIFKLLVFTFTFCSTLYFEIVNINAKENISNEKAMIQSEIDDKTNEYLNSDMKAPYVKAQKALFSLFLVFFSMPCTNLGMDSSAIQPF